MFNLDFLSPAAPEARDGRYCNAPRPSVCLSVTFSFRMPFKQIIMHAWQSQHDVDVHLLFCFDIDLHLTCSQLHVELGFSSSILTDGYHFVCSAQQSIWHFDKLLCIYCNAHMIYMYTYFVLTSINSRAATCPTSNCGRGTSLFRQELVLC